MVYDLGNAKRKTGGWIYGYPLDYILYAIKHNKPEERDWILCNLLNVELPNMADIGFRSYSINVPEKAYLDAFEWIAAETSGPVAVDRWMMGRAAKLGHVKLFRWLRGQELSITKEVVGGAAREGRVGILKEIYAINH